MSAEITKTFGGLTVVATLEPDPTGRMTIREMQLSGDHIDATALRRINITAIEAAASGVDVQPADLEAFAGRSRGETPQEFSKRVARAYMAACTLNHKPAVLMAERAGVPVSTVRGWIREARLRGDLRPGTRGRAG